MKNIKIFILCTMSVPILFAELSFGNIEEIFINSESNIRKVQIYYPTPTKKDINSETKFIIMNDGEELFSEEDSWNGMSWNIDDSFKELYDEGFNLNIIIIAIDSAKRHKGKIIDETRRYAEYFPKESIQYFQKGLKKYIYKSFIDTKKFDYPNFIVNEVIPSIETKFNVVLNKNNLGVIGASMGGLSSINLCLEYPELFGFVGSFSTHWVGIQISEYIVLPVKIETNTVEISGDKETTLAIKKYVQESIEKITDQKFYFDHGTLGLDSLYGVPQKEIDEIFNNNQIRFQTKVFPGHEHESPFFGKRFKSGLIYLLEK